MSCGTFLAGRPMTAASSTSQSISSEMPEIFTVAPGSASARAALMKCQALSPSVCGSGSGGRFMCARHFGGVIGVIGAGAIDRRRPAHRRQQLGAPSGWPLARLLPALRGRLAAATPCAARQSSRMPSTRRIGRLAGELRGIEHLVVDDEAGARALGGSDRSRACSRPSRLRAPWRAVRKPRCGSLAAHFRPSFVEGWRLSY